eukprot:CAMPEP_0175261502 /NCGR_PEP_ID=MMETSP0093-20121207/40794_1 /TAXON_ID=311494 /ORGANISM="Alexandrium monilatum, Strain CCMP3105" /LENGTH=56 /DNA_ID=CAMNT_0016555965 /DNA_START=377 /DNA_END=547 /DNA_ORIENTATION=+
MAPTSQQSLRNTQAPCASMARLYSASMMNTTAAPLVAPQVRVHASAHLLTSACSSR